MRPEAAAEWFETAAHERGRSAKPLDSVRKRSSREAALGIAVVPLLRDCG